MRVNLEEMVNYLHEKNSNLEENGLYCTLLVVVVLPLFIDIRYVNFSQMLSKLCLYLLISFVLMCVTI